MKRNISYIMAHVFAQASGAHVHDSELWRRELHDTDSGPAVIKTRFPETRKQKIKVSEEQFQE